MEDRKSTQAKSKKQESRRSYRFPAIDSKDGTGDIVSIVPERLPNREYTYRGGIYVDSKIQEIGHPLLRLLQMYNIPFISVLTDHVISGRSWEMACAMAILGEAGIYTGEVTEVKEGRVMFGDVDMVDNKRDLTAEKVFTSEDYKNGMQLFSTA
jgi:hypothetical protein